MAPGAVAGPRHAQVAAGGAELCVAEQLADAVQIDTGLQQMRGEAMPQRMDAAELLYAGGFAGQLAVERLLAGAARAAIELSKMAVRSSGVSRP